MVSQPQALRLAFGLVPAVRVHDETALPIIESEFLQSNNRGVVHLSLGRPFCVYSENKRLRRRFKRLKLPVRSVFYSQGLLQRM